MKNILIILLFTVTSGLSQEIDLEYGKVSLNDFKVQSIDSSKVHDAILTINNVSVSFVSGFQYVSIHQRIRIESIDGLAYANQQIDLLKYAEDGEEIVALKGATYNLEDEKIKTSILNEKELLSENLSSNSYIGFFNLPDVKVGSVIEFEYIIKSPFLNVEDIGLQYEIPIIYLNIFLQFPTYQSYYVETNPLAQFQLDFNKKDFDNGVDVLNIKKESSKYLDQDIQTQRIKSRGKPIVFSKKNIPALLDEPFSGELNKYQSKLVFSLADGYDEYYQRKIKSYNSTWEEVADYLSSNNNFGDQLKSSRFYRKELENEIEGTTNDEVKISKILSFLKSKVKWNSEYNIFTDQGVKNAYREGNGNVAEINLLLTNMLIESGIEAYPVIVSATDSDTPLFPTINGFDYVIVQARTNEATFLLDATEEYFNLKKIPQRALNRKGMLIEKRGNFQWLDLNANKIQKETTLLTLKLEDNFLVKGTGSKMLEDHSLLDPQMIKANSSEDAIKNYLKNNLFGLEVNNVEVDGLENLSQKITFRYELNYINAFDKINDEIFIQPLINEMHSKDIVELENRTTPLELLQPIDKTVIVNIEVPDGYFPIFIPESVKVVYGEGVGSYSYRTDFNNKIISTVVTYKMNTSIIMPENYETFRKFYKAILDKDAAKIILKKE